MMKLFLMILILFPVLSLAKELQDPTKPPIFSMDERGSIKPAHLSAIIISPNRRIAVINDKMVKVNQMVEGNRVVWIHSNSVQLQGIDGKIVLVLINKSIKKKVKGFYAGSAEFSTKPKSGNHK